MTCQNCFKASRYIKILSNGQEVCHHCGGFSEAGGTKTAGLLTRSSFRIRTEARKYEGDTIPPFAYNKSRRKIDVSQDFVKLYPDKAKDYFSDSEMSKSGNPDLVEHSNQIRKEIKKNKQEQAKSVKFTGSQEKAMERILTP